MCSIPPCPDKIKQTGLHRVERGRFVGISVDMLMDHIVGHIDNIPLFPLPLLAIMQVISLARKYHVKLFPHVPVDAALASRGVALATMPCRSKDPWVSWDEPGT